MRYWALISETPIFSPESHGKSRRLELIHPFFSQPNQFSIFFISILRLPVPLLVKGLECGDFVAYRIGRFHVPVEQSRLVAFGHAVVFPEFLHVAPVLVNQASFVARDGITLLVEPEHRLVLVHALEGIFPFTLEVSEEFEHTASPLR